MHGALIGVGLAAVAAAIGPISAHAQSQPQWVTGMLGSVVCGERCYVTLHDNEGKRILGGPCEASECRRWVRDPENAPGRFIGKKVRVRVRPGPAPDADGKPNPDMRFIAELNLLP
jgi:hypothetical protein